MRNNLHGPLVSGLLFDPQPPEPAAYVAAARSTFSSEFFPSLRRVLREHGTGARDVQQVLDVPLADATTIQATLMQ